MPEVDHTPPPDPGDAAPSQDSAETASPPPPPEADPTPAVVATSTVVADARIAELEQQLAEARTNLSCAERSRDLQRQLIAAGAVDLEAAVILAERQIGRSESPDLPAIVRTIRRRSPSLFRPPSRLTATGLPRLDDRQTADELAAIAAATGSRRAVLDYLRVRRA